MAAIRIGFILIFTILLTTGNSFAQQNILRRTVSISVQNKSLEETLDEVANSGRFYFSYNSRIIPADSIVTASYDGEKVETVLRDLLGKEIQFRISGNTLILVKKRSKKKEPEAAKIPSKYIIKGYVRSSTDGDAIEGVTINEVQRSNSAVSGPNGYYELTVSSKNEYLGLHFNRRKYLDTVIVVYPANGKDVNVTLKPLLKPVDEVEPLEVGGLERPQVESISMVRFFVPQSHIDLADNHDEFEKRIAQISFVPLIGTNRRMSGVIENTFSFNVLAGYSGQTKGIELGGLLNIVRRDMIGLQLSGFGNIVGGETRGIQAAGFFNNNLGHFSGVQFAGFSNVVWDTLFGVQISGFSNVVKGEMRGMQAAGFSNVTTGNVDGFQVSGFSNVAVGNVNSFQLSGFFNYGRNVRGMQAAGFANVTAGSVGGAQVSGFANIAVDTVGGAQVTGFANVARVVKATQVAGFLNVAREVRGSQIALFNVADTVGGATIGFFSFVRKGYHKLEYAWTETLPVTVAFRTGTHKFYNIFAAGYSPGSSMRWGIGYGFGTQKRFGDRAKLSFDFTCWQINEQGGWDDNVNLLARFSPNLAVRIAGPIHLFAGPDLNVQITSTVDQATGEFSSTLAPYSLFDEQGSTVRTRGWIGMRAGIRL